MCIHSLHHIHPSTPFPATSPLPPVPTIPPSRTCSAFLFSNFVEENKKHETLQVVSMKMCIMVQLIHPFESSSLLLSQLPMVAHDSLKFLYSRTVSTSTSFKFLVSFLCFIPPLNSLPLVWPVSYNIAAFDLHLHSEYEGEHANIGLLSLANFT
jgi:hypothetical protein